MSDNPNVGRVFNLPGSSVPDSLKVHIDSKENPHEVTAQQVGAIPDSVKGLAGGVATLDEMGKVPSEQIPVLIARTVLTIPAEGWQADASGGVALDLPLAGVTENMTPTVTLSAAALETAGACELRETCETLPGAVRFRAESAPGEEMSGELLLVLPSGVAGDMIPAGTIALEELREEVLGENGAVPALETAISDLDNSIFGTDGAVEALNKRIDDEIFGENGAATVLDAAVTTLRDAVFGTSKEPGALAELETALRDELLGENGVVTAANAEIEALRNEVLGESGAVESLDARISEEVLGDEGAVTAVSNELSALRDEVLGAGEEPGAIAYHVSELRGDLVNLSEYADSLHGELETVDTRIDTSVSALREEAFGEEGVVTKLGTSLETLRGEVFGDGKESGALEMLETAITDLETGLSETIEGKATELWNELIPLIEAFPPGVVAMYHLDGGTAPPPGWAWYETDEQGAPLPVSESRPGLVYIVRGT